ncbi:MAG TPA: endolytic transglycosylase MltG [Pilimelia sp.]|nr:endolytic transglycosylase MltG [Pilimelia sp.]
MIDELELAFEDRGDRGERWRHRRRRGSRPGGKQGRTGRSVLAMLVVLLLLGGLAGGAWWGFDKVRGAFSTPDYAGPGQGEVTVEVRSGQTASDIATSLVNAGVVQSAGAFIDAATANPRSKNIQPGFYKLRKEMRAADALGILLDLKNKVVSRVTIPEGLMTLDIYDRLAKATGIPVQQFKDAARDPVALGVPAWWFNRLDKKPSVRSAEGFLFPASYEFPPKPTAAQILKIMVQQFLAVTTELKFVETVQAERGGISPYEALITASIVQAEVKKPAEMGRAARAMYTRAYKGDFPCNCLQVDATINYWLRLQGKSGKSSSDLLASELQNARNPYNTHVAAGLPVGPIGSPGKDALNAAMRPPVGAWTYWVTVDKQGTTLFANDYNGHLANIRKACANEVITGPACG